MQCIYEWNSFTAYTSTSSRNNVLILDSAFTQVHSLEIAQKSSYQYSVTSMLNATSVDNKPSDLNTIATRRTWFFCGGPRHKHQSYPAKDTICHNCEKPGHFDKLCQSSNKKSST